MREHHPKEKRLAQVTLPDNLVAFLVEVLAQIQRREPEAMLESDDLLQQDAVYGGRLDAEGDEWGFTFFPGPGAGGSGKRAKWELVFTLAQLEAIAAGTLRSVPLFVCADPACGCRFASARDSCFDCDYQGRAP